MDYFIIFIVGIIGGAFGTLSGGCSVFTIPTLIFIGLPAPVAVATNRLGLTGMSLMGWGVFHRKNLINYRVGLAIGIPAILGSIIGANIVASMDKDLLQKIIAILSIFILIVFVLNSKKGVEEETFHIQGKHYIAGGIISFFLGIYGGFYGAAFATCLNYLLVLLFGQTFLESAATHKIAMVGVCILSSIIFAFHDLLHYPLGLTQFGGMAIGSYFGSQYSDKIGNVWIKRFVIGLGFVMAVKLLF